jgi:hypothetical protein
MTRAIARQVREIEGIARAAHGSTTHTDPARTATQTRRYGDGVGYAAALAERCERRIRYLRGLSKCIDEIVEAVGGCLPDDPAMVRALITRERTKSKWTRIASACEVSPSDARNSHADVLRRVIRLPWTNRELAAAVFAKRFVRSAAMARTLKPAGTAAPK